MSYADKNLDVCERVAVKTNHLGAREKRNYSAQIFPYWFLKFPAPIRRSHDGDSWTMIFEALQFDPLWEGPPLPPCLSVLVLLNAKL